MILINKIKDFILTKKQHIIVYSILILLLSLILIVQNKKNSELDLQNTILQNKVDSLILSKQYADKLIDLNIEILEQKNKPLIEKKEEYEAKISALDSADLELEYDKNLRTIKEYLEDRKKYRK